MDERALRVLEYTKIREMLAEHALSEPGRQQCLALMPSDNLGEVRRAMGESEEADLILTHLGYHPVTAFDTIDGPVGRLRIGASLSPRELLHVARFLRACRLTRDALIRREEQRAIHTLASGLTTLHDAEDAIASAILSEEEVADNASPELSHLRRQIRSAHQRIRDKLDDMIRSASMQKLLQESIVTMRNGRYVVPVKQEARSSVPGIVHDQSGSGATLFIEPMSVVEINNDLRALASREADEIERILAALSARLEPSASFIETNQTLMAALDFCFAKAALGRAMRGIVPELNMEGNIHVRRARHPLLPKESVVPCDLWLGNNVDHASSFHTLIITGPNTGGKTVTLKTIGLLTLMAQAGLLVPADPGTKLCVFDAVFADIGDEQSIEQSLSTFSGHMRNIVSIMQRITPRSLALFDELGAGTDPTEGAALAMSILDALRRTGARVMATTHYSELKAYALAHADVENASVEFNVETLRPTYRLSIGVPGKSNAFEISARLGLDAAVIADARERLSKEQIRFEEVISNAEYHRQVAERERLLAEQASVENTRLRDEAEALRAQIEKQKTEILQKAKEEARMLVRRAKAEAEHAIAELKKLDKADAATRQKTVAQTRQHFERSLDGLGGIEAPQQPAGTPPKGLKVGETVALAHLGGTHAVVLKVDDKGDGRGEALVQAGVMKMTVAIENLRRVQEKATARNVRNVKQAEASESAPRTASMEIDLRGSTIEEGILELDLFVDRAVLTGLKEIWIIHGKGTGALRAGIQAHLRKHPSVAGQRLGKYGEGEDGITVATLR